MVLMPDYRDKIQSHLLGSARIKQQVAETCAEAIVIATETITDSLRAGGKLLLCGNGGSAADCQHMAAELVSQLSRDLDRPGLAAIALTTDTSFLTAFANDCGYEGVFERQVEALGRPGDVLIGISTSGNSGNVIRAMDRAMNAGMRTVALTGSGGRLTEIADIVISVPSNDTQYIQEAHLAIEHLICYIVEHRLFGKWQAPSSLSSNGARSDSMTSRTTTHTVNR
jgi:D-sedoheptulose 7-phosphate isomerase